MKIVINNCFGGFSISRECAELMEKLGCKHAASELNEWRQIQSWLDAFKETGKWPDDVKDSVKGSLEISIKYNSDADFYGYGYTQIFPDSYDRKSEYLISAVEKLGNKANGRCAKLKVVEIPDGIEWGIDEYDGLESIHEVHRSWG